MWAKPCVAIAHTMCGTRRREEGKKGRKESVAERRLAKVVLWIHGGGGGGRVVFRTKKGSSSGYLIWTPWAIGNRLGKDAHMCPICDTRMKYNIYLGKFRLRWSDKGDRQKGR